MARLASGLRCEPWSRSPAQVPAAVRRCHRRACHGPAIASPSCASCAYSGYLARAERRVRSPHRIHGYKRWDHATGRPRLAAQHRNCPYMHRPDTTANGCPDRAPEDREVSTGSRAHLRHQVHLRIHCDRAVTGVDTRTSVDAYLRTQMDGQRAGQSHLPKTPAGYASDDETSPYYRVERFALNTACRAKWSIPDAT